LKARLCSTCDLDGVDDGWKTRHEDGKSGGRSSARPILASREDGVAKSHILTARNRRQEVKKGLLVAAISNNGQRDVDPEAGVAGRSASVTVGIGEAGRSGVKSRAGRLVQHSGTVLPRLAGRWATHMLILMLAVEWMKWQIRRGVGTGEDEDATVECRRGAQSCPRARPHLDRAHNSSPRA
jgi:hypothetical protein